MMKVGHLSQIVLPHIRIFALSVTDRDRHPVTAGDKMVRQSTQVRKGRRCNSHPFLKSWLFIHVLEIKMVDWASEWLISSAGKFRVLIIKLY